MWAVYLCGATDCFLHAIFQNKKDAEVWMEENSRNPEGAYLREWKTISEIDTSDTGWS